MTQEQRDILEKNLKAGEVAINIEHKQIGVDNDGYPIFEIIFINAPAQYKLIKLIEVYNGAILQDLTDEATA